MSRMIKFLSIAVILFSVAAGASWYFQNMQHSEDETAKVPDEKSSAKVKAGSPVSKGSLTEAAPSRSIPRPSTSPEVDRLAKETAATLQQQQDSVKARNSNS